jgi:hypothetical protein
MDESLSEWLRLRESADRAARSAVLTRTIAEAVASDEPIQLLDLATGTGSNIRYLAEHLPARQRWLVVDRDPVLLAELPERMSAWGAARGYQVRRETAGCTVLGERLECRIDAQHMDLGTLDDKEIFEGRHLVTASALLDLVSDGWLRSLAHHCRAAGAAALFTITYNGRSSCTPPEAEDEMVRNLMNRHQKTDKGLGGPAAGPDAVDSAARCFADAGYRVQTAPSDWILEPAEHQLQRQLIDGWAEAATAIAPDIASTIARWRLRRLQHLDAGRSRIVVNHDDVAAWLPAR